MNSNLTVDEMKLKDGKHISCTSCSEAILKSDKYCSNCGKQSSVDLKEKME
ncbi:hypothetical protein ACFWMS_05580 [Peribacillus butanolivorans]|uniref:hypothetical protein n=1 Tax=Peribacillus butanolivorans TaxID=421767 RepID=UPI00365092AD